MRKAFFDLDGSLKRVGPLTVLGDSTGVLVNDQHPAVSDDIVHVFFQQMLGLKNRFGFFKDCRVCVLADLGT